MIKQLMNALESQDYAAVCKCFANDSFVSFIDYGPSCVGRDSFHIYGQTAIELFFRDQFYNNAFENTPRYLASKTRIEDEHSATYFCCYTGKYVFVRLTIEELDNNGLIRKAVVRPE